MAGSPDELAKLESEQAERNEEIKRKRLELEVHVVRGRLEAWYGRGCGRPIRHQRKTVVVDVEDRRDELNATPLANEDWTY